MRKSLACLTLLIVPLASCSDIKATWNKTWRHEEAKPAAMAAPPPPTEMMLAMHKISAKGVGASIGTIHLTDTPAGMKIATDLHGLPYGKHGFHIHVKPDCGPGEDKGKMAAGMAAGGHLDPAQTGKHEGPKGSGHLGDLPVLTVNKKGIAKEELLAPHVKVAQVLGHSLMIHKGGDNYSDKPKPLGGGGVRIACGVAG